MKGLFPDEYFAFVLPIHRGLPPEDQPVLYARYLTPNERRRIYRIRDEAMALATAAERGAADGEDDPGEAAAMAKLVELWQARLCGWKARVGKRLAEFTPENIAAFVSELDVVDRWGIIAFADDAVALRRDDLGKSVSPWPSAAASSAPAASEPAQTPSQRTKPALRSPKPAGAA